MNNIEELKDRLIELQKEKVAKLYEFEAAYESKLLTAKEAIDFKVLIAEINNQIEHVLFELTEANLKKRLEESEDE